MSYTTNVPGLPGGPLVTTYPIHVGATDANGDQSFIPIGWQRPGTKAHTPRRSVQHGTANPSSHAADDASWFVKGAGGEQASVHAEADDVGVWVIVPLDEIAYHAADGNGPGNTCGFATEMCEADDVWTDPTRRDNCIYVNADFMGRVAAREGATKPEQHWDFNAGDPNRHDCPYKLRHVVMPDGRLAWDHYVGQWSLSNQDELARMHGRPTPTPQPQPQPVPPPGQATPQSPWRTLGDTTPDVFTAEFSRKRSPILAEVDAVYAAVKGFSLLYLAQCGKESEYATTGEGAKIADHNPLGNRNPDGSYRTFPSYAANAAWYVAHITDPNGPYAATTSIADYVHVYAPARDGNNEPAYCAFICDDRNRFPPLTPQPTPTPTPTPAPPPAPVYAKPIVPPFLADPTKIPDGDQPYNGVVLYRCHRAYKATAATPVLQYADPGSPVKLRADVQPGDVFVGEYVFYGQPYQGESRWVMTTYGSRVPMAGLTPKVDFKP